MTDLTFWTTAAGAAYLFLAALTLAFLLVTDRKGRTQPVARLGTALVWPAYWLLVQGPRRSLVMAAKLVASALFVLALPVIGAGFVLALGFDSLGRRGLMPRFLSGAA